MDKTLNSYVFLYKDFISSEICNQTVEELASANWQQHEFYDSKNNQYSPKSGNQELEMARKTLSTTPLIMNKIWQGLDAYTKSINFPWFNGWQGYTEVRYNRYLENKLMAEHCDHIHDIFDGERKGVPILTVLGLLNNDFSGGNFVMWGDEVIELEQGDVLIFPSNFLYPHKVQPVTSGVRHTFISWAW
jgi:predicted 2-oxoglutarate/Fe(II)-dependent dioxygenase YbiX